MLRPWPESVSAPPSHCPALPSTLPRTGPATRTGPPLTANRPAPPSLLAAGTERDPYPLYRVLRERHPLVYDEPFGAWLVPRYADVRAALADSRLVAVPPGRTLAHLEGGTHSAHRAVVSPAFRGPRWPP